jgi:hypothetical protein
MLPWKHFPLGMGYANVEWRCLPGLSLMQNQVPDFDFSGKPEPKIVEKFGTLARAAETGRFWSRSDAHHVRALRA